MKKLIFFTALILTSGIGLSQTPCQNGFAGIYPCNDYDLMSQITLGNMSAGAGNDSWGWTDPTNGNEYAIIGLDNGTAFINISDPVNPVYLGKLPTATTNSAWRDVKVYNNHAFIVSEAANHGMQVFDLTRLRNIASPPENFTADALYTDFGNAHNIVINEDTGYAYSVGTSTFNGGPHFINIQNPTNPVAAGGYAMDGYSHDAQVVTYNGPDSDYTGREILIGSNEDEVVIVDITDKTNPITVSSIAYLNVGYTHQGWFTENERYFILGDELDETNVGFNTRTIVFDFLDLDNPQQHVIYNGPTPAIDHNGYVKGDIFYLANYRAGVRIIDVSDIGNQNMTEVGYFDTYPSSDSAAFNGVWNVYPYFASGNIVISDIEGGFFLIKKSDGNGGGTTDPCSGTVSTFPEIQSFETNFGTWTNSASDDIDWTRNTGGTPSNNTGPSDAADGTTYIYVEASNPNFPSKTAILNSPCYDLSGDTETTFNFSYHMFGSTVGGQIDLEISTDDGVNWVSIWNKTGNNGNQWNTESINLNVYAGQNNVRLRFNRVTGGTWQSDVALDAFQITTSTGGGSEDCTGGVTIPYSESFESSIGVWTQDTTNDDIDWTRDNGGTPSNNTGPSSGSNGSWYMYVEASGNNTGYPNRRAILNAPCIDLSTETTANFNFDFHMFGATDGGRVDLEASTDGTTWTSLWNAMGTNGNQWNTISVSLDAYAGGTVQLRYNRITGGTWQSDVAIDNITITAGGGNGPPTYCTSNGNSTADEYIQRVQIGTIDNTTGASAGGYGDFTNLSTNLGSTNTITITPLWTGTVYNEAYAVFVDWNQDGDFNDSGELAFSQTPTTATPITGSFNIPSGAIGGSTRMRVSMKYNGIPTACESFQYGEVEDYTVVVAASANNAKGPSDTNITTIKGLSIWPNPVKRGMLHINSLEIEPTNYSVFSLSGQKILSGIYKNTIDVSALSNGVYIIEINAPEKVFIDRFIVE